MTIQMRYIPIISYSCQQAIPRKFRENYSNNDG